MRPFISTPCLLHMNPIRSGLDPETMLVFCFVFLKTFEEGGGGGGGGGGAIGAQKVDVA